MFCTGWHGGAFWLLHCLPYQPGLSPNLFTAPHRPFPLVSYGFVKGAVLGLLSLLRRPPISRSRPRLLRLFHEEICLRPRQLFQCNLRPERVGNRLPIWTSTFRWSPLRSTRGGPCLWLPGKCINIHHQTHVVICQCLFDSMASILPSFYIFKIISWILSRWGGWPSHLSSSWLKIFSSFNCRQPWLVDLHMIFPALRMLLSSNSQTYSSYQQTRDMFLLWSSCLLEVMSTRTCPIRDTTDSCLSQSPHRDHQPTAC